MLNEQKPIQINTLADLAKLAPGQNPDTLSFELLDQMMQILHEAEPQVYTVQLPPVLYFDLQIYEKMRAHMIDLGHPIQQPDYDKRIGAAHLHLFNVDTHDEKELHEAGFISYIPGAASWFCLTVAGLVEGEYRGLDTEARHLLETGDPDGARNAVYAALSYAQAHPAYQVRALALKQEIETKIAAVARQVVGFIGCIVEGFKCKTPLHAIQVAYLNRPAKIKV